MNSNRTVCETTVSGNPAGPALFFIHGWPDNASLWREQVNALETQFRCICLTLPNFGDRTVKAGGFDFPQLIEQVVATIRAEQAEGPVRLVTHDWGAYLGYLLDQTHPGLVGRMAAFDVGAHMGKTNLKTKLMIIGYQWALIVCWLIGGLVPPLGGWLSRGVGRVIGVPARQRSNLRSRYNYPYFYLWRGLLLPSYRGRLLHRYRPGCPLLFQYGKRKPMMFHSEKWLQIVEDSGGRAYGVEGAGHWLMESHAAEVNPQLVEWFGSA